MSRDRLTDPIDAAPVFEPNGNGDRTATEWIEPQFPDGTYRFVERGGELVLQWHAYAVATLLGDMETRDNLRAALGLCRVRPRVIDPEDCE